MSTIKARLDTFKTTYLLIDPKQRGYPPKHASFS